MAVKLTEKQIKDGWQIVKFGEIAKEVKKTTKTPLEDGLEFYIGLEHLDPQSLRITRKGIIAEDNPSFTRRFTAGQILFGKRRAYQKKAAITDFDGICSGDIIVIEEIPGKIISGLLPFIVQSDAFFDWAVQTSSGSLSPRTKWKSLAEFEFPLPPIERQKEILEVLEKVEEVEKRTLYCLESCLIALRRFADYACNNDRFKNPLPKFKRYRLKDVCKSNAKSLGTKTEPNYKFRYVDISSCTFPGQLTILENLTFKDAPSRAKRVVQDGDTLVSTVRPNHQATCYFEKAHNIVCSTGFTVITPNDNDYRKWIFYCTLTKQFVHNLSNLMVGTSFPAVNDDDILVQHVDLPNKDILHKWENILDSVYDSYKNLKSKCEMFSGLRTQLMAQFLKSINDGYTTKEQN